MSKMISSKVKYLWLPLFALVFVSIGTYQFAYSNEITVSISNDGFSPQELVITPGTTVVFKNTSDTDTWPASDSHPNHSDFQEFDSKEAIKPGDSWTFRFDKVGVWNYHDHMNPSRFAIIVVTDEPLDVPLDSFSDCFEDGILTDEYCIRKNMETTIENSDIPAAFDVLKHLAKMYPTTCHQAAHRVGEASYNLITADTPTTLPENTGMCNRGFWHGIAIEYTNREGANLSGIKNFCEEVLQPYASNTRRMVESCYQGFGLSLAWQELQKVPVSDYKQAIETALDTCDQIQASEASLYECWGGVYTSLRDFVYEQNRYNEITSFDHLEYCSTQRIDRQKKCVVEAIITLDDKDKIITDISKLQLVTKENGERFILSKAASVTQLIAMGEIEINDHIEQCLALPTEYVETCFFGAGRGLAGAGDGSPDPYALVNEYCSNDSLDTSERQACYLGANSFADFTEIGKHEIYCKNIPEESFPPSNLEEEYSKIIGWEIKNYCS